MDVRRIVHKIDESKVLKLRRRPGWQRHTWPGLEGHDYVGLD